MIFIEGILELRRKYCFNNLSHTILGYESYYREICNFERKIDHRNHLTCSELLVCIDGRCWQKHRWQQIRVRHGQERWSSRPHFLLGYRGIRQRLQQLLLG